MVCIICSAVWQTLLCLCVYTVCGHSSHQEQGRNSDVQVIIQERAEVGRVERASTLMTSETN